MTSRAIAPTSRGKKAFSILVIPIIVLAVVTGTGTTAYRSVSKAQPQEAGLTGNRDLLDDSSLDCLLNQRRWYRTNGTRWSHRVRVIGSSVGIGNEGLAEIGEAIA
jgi:hypothetical protein